MSIFCYKKLDATERLGEKLQRKREESGWSVAEFADRTRIQRRYIEAFEQGRYQELPAAKAYRLAYLRQVVEELGLNAADAAAQFNREDGLEMEAHLHPRKNLRWLPFSSLAIFARNIVLIALVLGFGAYLAAQVYGINRKPNLVVYAPPEGYVIDRPTTVVQGETDRENRLKVNGQPIMVNNRGQFSTPINLANGVNTIIVSATTKHGKTADVTRHLVVRSSTPVSLK